MTSITGFNFCFYFHVHTPLWFWLAVRIETVSLTCSNFCFHPHCSQLLYGFGSPCGSKPFPSPALIVVLTFIRLLFPFIRRQSRGYPIGSMQHPSPALTLLFTFMTSLLSDFVFLSNLSWNCAPKQNLFHRDATYDSDGPSVLNKQ